MGWANARVVVDCGMNPVPNRNILLMLVRTIHAQLRDFFG